MAREGRVEHGGTSGWSVDAPRALEVGAALLEVGGWVEQEGEGEQACSGVGVGLGVVGLGVIGLGVGG